MVGFVVGSVGFQGWVFGCTSVFGGFGLLFRVVRVWRCFRGGRGCLVLWVVGFLVGFCVGGGDVVFFLWVVVL